MELNQENEKQNNAELQESKQRAFRRVNQDQRGCNGQNWKRRGKEKEWEGNKKTKKRFARVIYYKLQVNPRLWKVPCYIALKKKQRKTKIIRAERAQGIQMKKAVLLPLISDSTTRKMKLLSNSQILYQRL